MFDNNGCFGWQRALKFWSEDKERKRKEKEE